MCITFTVPLGLQKVWLLLFQTFEYLATELNALILGITIYKKIDQQSKAQ